jgi:excinuclease ABC subunit C
VHRYAIKFHREKRSKRQISSELDSIKGIGPKTKEILLKRFKSVKKIQEADIKALIECIGEAKAKIVKDFFEKKSTTD